MLLSLHNLYPSPPPKTLQIPSSPFFPIPKTLLFQYPLNPFCSFTRCSASVSDSQILPHSAIQRIADKLRSLGFTEQNPDPQTLNTDLQAETRTAGEIFVPLPHQLSKYRVGHTLDPSWSTPENPVPKPGSGNAIVRYHEMSEEVKKEQEARKRESKAPTLAELSLPVGELRRLRRIGIAEKRKLKIGKVGITEGIVNGIHERWRRAEVVKIVCEDLCRLNMKRTHDLLERKTGGMVVWRSGGKIVLYRGVNYKYPYFLSDTAAKPDTSIDNVQDITVDYMGDKMETCLSGADSIESSGPSPTHKKVGPTIIQGVGYPNRVRFQLPAEAQLAEEVDCLLDGLGPRFADWWGYEPLPVDADLLPAIVPGYRKPFRLLPYGIKPKLTDDEMTALRRLGRPLPCHFALGRNRKLQGLAASIVKLWEKCEIAKIAVKRGVQNTNSEMMAEELKWLTGGTLISRDKEFIVLYRGKDFLPSAVSSAIEERRKRVIHVDKQRRDYRVSSETAEEAEDTEDVTVNSGSRGEFDVSIDHSSDLSKQKKLRQNEAAIQRTTIRLAMALEKKAKAERLLAELENSEIPQQLEKDKEGITNEERYMLRKVGLKMKPFLLLGRRGVFDGTIENMHLHWKYRELVKIICKERSLQSVNEVAQTLEAESGGILVAVERVSKGYAIIVYRGKNYQRPSRLRPPTLLSKREAMKRSLEAQRRESLKLNVLRLTRNINDLKQKLAQDKNAHNMQPFDKTRDSPEADSNYSISNDDLYASFNNIQPGERTNQTDPSLPFDGNGIDKTGLQFSSESVSEGTHINADVNGGAAHLTSFPDTSLLEQRSCSPLESAQHCVPDNDIMRSTVESSATELEELVSVSVGKENVMPSKAVCLSNRDRLMLRKQALKMKKRPVLAVGRSNIVTGVAKTIKAHFQKYPLAIVNVKGRAKGTSVQEVVFQLEQATGGVLVSQEPSKVILYRGWGAFDEPCDKIRKGVQDAGKTPVGREVKYQNAVSAELMAAIRLECGLQYNHDRKHIPKEI